MAVKVFFLLCIEAVFAKTAYTQCIGGGFPSPYGFGRGYDGLHNNGFALTPFDGYGIGAVENFGFNHFDIPYGSSWPSGFGGAGYIPPSPVFANPLYGGGMPLPSGSSIPPASISVVSENFIDGTLSVVGQLPFIASVAMSGEFPSVGSGTVSYGCGDGGVRIFGEGIPASYIPTASVIGPMDYAGLRPYGPAFGEVYREFIPYTGCSFNPFY